MTSCVTMAIARLTAFHFVPPELADLAAASIASLSGGVVEVQLHTDGSSAAAAAAAVSRVTTTCQRICSDDTHHRR